MNQEFYKKTKEYKTSSKIQKLWTDLSISMNKVAPGESIMERKREPWNSKFEEVRKYWDRLTAPENLELLKEWYDPENMNPNARKTTEIAIEHCEEKQNRETNKD